jgi:hypothetical protein
LFLDETKPFKDIQATQSTVLNMLSMENKSTTPVLHSVENITKPVETTLSIQETLISTPSIETSADLTKSYNNSNISSSTEEIEIIIDFGTSPKTAESSVTNFIQIENTTISSIELPVGISSQNSNQQSSSPQTNTSSKNQLLTKPTLQFNKLTLIKGKMPKETASINKMIENKIPYPKIKRSINTLKINDENSKGRLTSYAYEKASKINKYPELPVRK